MEDEKVDREQGGRRKSKSTQEMVSDIYDKRKQKNDGRKDDVSGIGKRRKGEN